MEQLIREAGREPVERDTLYRRVIRDQNDRSQWTIGENVEVAGMSH
jgi:aminodeoxyfutalosine synthase